MNYLIYGTQKYLIENELNKIKSKFEDINISKYDLEINTIKEIIDDANTFSLFEGNKLIIIDNSFIFSRIIKKIDNVEILEEYLSNTNSKTIMVFIDRLDKIDSVKKIVKLIKNNGTIKEFNEQKSIINIVKDMFEGYQITTECINSFIDRVGSNLDILYQESEKLKIYKIKEKIILKEDILNLTTENINIDIYKFVDDIINKNISSAIKTYHKLLELNEEPIKIVALIASKFRVMYQTTVLAKKGYSEEEMSNMLGIHKYPIHLALISSNKYSTNILIQYLKILADLDIGMKTGEKNKELGLELFILSL